LNALGKWIQELDRILRGDATRLSALREGKIEVNARGLAVVGLFLACFYGFCMGWFAVLNRESPEVRQLLAAVVKVPLLFFLTLVVTFPSLYVFNALIGSRLGVVSLFRLLVAALGVLLAVLASFGPIVAFFSLTTTNYPFMVLLNVLLFAVAGVLGLAFLLQTLHRLTLADQALPAAPGAPEGAPAAAVPAGALERTEGYVPGRNVRSVFQCWVIVFALVGAQMSWVLRPFIGNPSQPFEWFRSRESHFFEAIWETLRSLFS
jgi:hypothetical protein